MQPPLVGKKGSEIHRKSSSLELSKKSTPYEGIDFIPA
jgi:hypothetical protein